MPGLTGCAADFLAGAQSCGVRPAGRPYGQGIFPLRVLRRLRKQTPAVAAQAQCSALSSAGAGGRGPVRGCAPPRPFLHSPEHAQRFQLPLEVRGSAFLLRKLPCFARDGSSRRAIPPAESPGDRDKGQPNMVSVRAARGGFKKSLPGSGRCFLLRFHRPACAVLPPFPVLPESPAHVRPGGGRYAAGVLHRLFSAAGAGFPRRH